MRTHQNEALFEINQDSWHACAQAPIRRRRVKR